MTDKLELKSCHKVIDTVSVADVDSIFYGKPIDPDFLTVVMKDGKRLYCDEVCPIDSMQEEPVSEDLEEAAEQYAKDYLFTPAPTRSLTDHFKAGAKWQKQQMMKDAIRLRVAKIFNEDEVYSQLVINIPKLKTPFKEGDKVKIIIAKED